MIKKNMINNKTLLVTGGTGSFGKNFIQLTLKKYNPKKIIVYSRDEMKQWFMAKELEEYKNKIQFIIGDVRDSGRLNHCCRKVDYIFHAAATKIIPTAESNPEECVKTNINGAINVIDAAIKNQVSKVVALSTDKACNPINLYGATKLASDKLFISANFNSSHKTKFSIVRYGNVISSRGSIIPYFKSLSKKGVFPITDLKMTRFFLSLDDAVKLVWLSLSKMTGGEIFVKKIPSILITDIAKAINPNAKFKVIGIRPGEKINEQLISEDDSRFTYDFNEYYKILPSLAKNISSYKKGGIKVKSNFFYSSNNNSEWLNVKKIKKIIEKN